jgi:hypothetical protein
MRLAVDGALVTVKLRAVNRSTKVRTSQYIWDPGTGTSSIDWVQLSRFLPEDGDRIQSPKRYVLNKKQ